MKVEDIKILIEALDQSSIAKLEFAHGDHVLKLEKEKKDMSAVVTQVVNPVANQLMPVGDDIVVASEEVSSQKVEKDASIVNVLAPLVGVFYQASSPGTEAHVKVGQYVNEGDTVCILEAMKVLNEIKAPKSGTILAIHVKNGDVVEFNQVLMEIGD